MNVVIEELKEEDYGASLLEDLKEGGRHRRLWRIGCKVKLEIRGDVAHASQHANNKTGSPVRAVERVTTDVSNGVYDRASHYLSSALQTVCSHLCRSTLGGGLMTLCRILDWMSATRVTDWAVPRSLGKARK